jgi:hypothetical protein
VGEDKGEGDHLSSKNAKPFKKEPKKSLPVAFY